MIVDSNATIKPMYHFVAVAYLASIDARLCVREKPLLSRSMFK